MSAAAVGVSLRLRPALAIDEEAEAPAAEPPVVYSGDALPQSRAKGRPSLATEKSARLVRQVLLDPSEPGVAAYASKKFRFRHTFGSDASTYDVFDAQREAVLGVLKGFDATVMCYGSTGAG